jgi:hypothetical protein
VVGVFLASLLLEGVLIRQALREEAATSGRSASATVRFRCPGR